MNQNKQFDCIGLKNTIQELILHETEGMTVRELLDYFNSNFIVKKPHLYDLSYEEATVIEPEFPLSKKEYEGTDVGK